MRPGLLRPRPWRAFFAALIACVILTAQSSALRAQEFADAVFRVFAEFDSFTSTGTSFVVNAEDGIFVTNFHVVFDERNGATPPNRLQIGYLDDQNRAQFVEATVLWQDQRNDLAVLQATLPIATMALPILRSEERERGNVPFFPPDRDRVFAVGFPGVADTFSDTRGAPPEILRASITDGIVSRVYRFSGRGQVFGRPVVQHSAQINAGNSGGPLIDECGRVVAVNTLKPVLTVDLDRATPQDREIINQTPDGVFWATHTNALLELLETSVEGLVISEGPCEPGLPFDLPEPQNLWVWVAAGAGIVVLGLVGGVVFLRSSATNTNRRVLSQMVREKLAERAGGAETGGRTKSFWRRKNRDDADKASSNPMVRLAAEARSKNDPEASSGGGEQSWSAQMAAGADGGQAAQVSPEPQPQPVPQAEPMAKTTPAFGDRNVTRPAPPPGGGAMPISNPPDSFAGGQDVIQPVSEPPYGGVAEPAPMAAAEPEPMPEISVEPVAEGPSPRGEDFNATRPIGQAPEPEPEPEPEPIVAPEGPQRIVLRGDSEVTVSSAWLDEQPDRALTIGRSRDEADLTLDSLAISRIHARLTHRAGGFWVEDAGSSNGTKVNGTKISAPTRLSDGDVVHFGDEKFDIELS